MTCDVVDVAVIDRLCELNSKFTQSRQTNKNITKQTNAHLIRLSYNVCVSETNAHCCVFCHACKPTNAHYIFLLLIGLLILSEQMQYVVIFTSNKCTFSSFRCHYEFFSFAEFFFCHITYKPVCSYFVTLFFLRFVFIFIANFRNIYVSLCQIISK